MGIHLTFEPRCLIEVLPGADYTQAEIAASADTSQSAVSRELARNHGQRGHRCKQAQGKAEARRSAASAVPRKMSEAVIAAMKPSCAPSS
jgi:IS30 family transposase